MTLISLFLSFLENTA
ncbi:hypothetical protein F383_39172 [Gossypium arboreum]|uniref:Uncharacterized protein n=1 Tax=Gossypium arboreum TaxID=29729 RepID=A0A0B0MNL1_GOSAR|nr:hypothetical protein F383_39172 [Gossypium arboreum]